MNMETVFDKARLRRALTALDRVEFARLEEGLETFLAAERTERRHAYGAGGPGNLPTTRAQLLFTLFTSSPIRCGKSWRGSSA